jgi:hypothetical protein
MSGWSGFEDAEADRAGESSSKPGVLEDGSDGVDQKGDAEAPTKVFPI